jgi:hypothetical protein
MTDLTPEQIHQLRIVILFSRFAHEELEKSNLDQYYTWKSMVAERLTAFGLTPNDVAAVVGSAA